MNTQIHMSLIPAGKKNHKLLAFLNLNLLSFCGRSWGRITQSHENGAQEYNVKMNADKAGLQFPLNAPINGMDIIGGPNLGKSSGIGRGRH
jgi:hypothetical protein